MAIHWDTFNGYPLYYFLDRLFDFLFFNKKRAAKDKTTSTEK
ncbi:hypothetical protein RV09_GL001663 [Enterococcus moraviensis]|nr:hypothetical protein RV09_GL001663 [Enterococcus moraviensis]